MTATNSIKDMWSNAGPPQLSHFYSGVTARLRPPSVNDLSGNVV